MVKMRRNQIRFVGQTHALSRVHKAHWQGLTPACLEYSGLHVGFVVSVVHDWLILVADGHGELQMNFDPSNPMLPRRPSIDHG